MSQCALQAEIPEWQLEAYLDGLAPAEVAQHLMQCTHCAERLSTLRDLTTRLAMALERADCPSNDDLRAYRWHQMTHERHKQVADHLRTCQACSRELAVLVGPSIARSDTAGVPDASPLRVAALFIARLVRQEGLTLPSLRGAAPAAMLYEIPGLEWAVLLEQTTEALGYVLAGQILSPEPLSSATRRVSALTDDQVPLEVGVDEAGGFVLHPLRAGHYTLWITVDEITINLPDVTIESVTTV